MPQEHFLILDQAVEAETVAAQTSSAIITIGPAKQFTISVDGKCYLNWSGAGATTALPALTAADFTTIEFAAPDQIVRASGSWVDDGYDVAGRTVIVQNAATAANIGTFTVESATATNLTTVEVTIENEVASATERIIGYAPLEVDDTAVLLPAAGSYDFKSGSGCEAIRIYNPDAVNDLLVTVFISNNS